MAEETNGSAAPSGQTQRQVAINAKYVKDLSFENPRAPHSFLQPTQGAPLGHQMGVGINAQGLAPDVYEVALTVKLETKLGEDTVFVAELTYGAVVSLLNTPQEEVGAALMVDTPQMLFPSVSTIIAEVTRDGGYTPFLMPPVDFAEVYRRRLAEQQQAPSSPVPV